LLKSFAFVPMDRRLLERTVALASSTKAFDAKKLPKTLRLAIDSMPLEGAGRVEDTINLLAHAARASTEPAMKIAGRSSRGHPPQDLRELLQRSRR